MGLRVVYSGNFGATDGYPSNFDGWAADANGYALAVFSARPDSIGDGDVISQHRYLAQCFRTVTDKVDPFEWCSDLSVFDQIALGQRENEVSVRDVDLTATK